MSIKYADAVIKEIEERGSITTPKNCVNGEAFEEWLYKENNFDLIKLEDEVNSLYEKITKILINKKLLITTMESCTSGLIANLITNTEGASSILKGAFITYSNEVKIMQGVSSDVIDKYGVYSKETSIEMALNCKKRLNSNIGIGVTGTMGNVDPLNDDSSIGKVFFTIIKNDKIFSYELNVPFLNSRYFYKLYVAKEIGLKLIEILDKE